MAAITYYSTVTGSVWGFDVVAGETVDVTGFTSRTLTRLIARGFLVGDVAGGDVYVGPAAPSTFTANKTVWVKTP